MIGDRVEAFETAHVVILPVRLEPSPAHGSFRSHRVDVADASTDQPESVDPSDVEVAPAGVPDAVPHCSVVWASTTRYVSPGRVDRKAPMRSARPLASITWSPASAMARPPK